MIKPLDSTSDATIPKRSYDQAFSRYPDIIARPLPPESTKEGVKTRELSRPPAAAVSAEESGLHSDTRAKSITEQALEGKKQYKMRSSIACQRCRKSKIRCSNEGGKSACAACVTSNRQCIYPLPVGAQGSIRKRSEPASGNRTETEGDVKRIRKRDPDSARKLSVRQDEPTLHPLLSPRITRATWSDILATFKLHFSTEMPFVHEGTFHRWIEQPVTETASQVQDFLLGMLALTARFNQTLTDYHSPGVKNPRIASQFYADALISRVCCVSLGEPSLERCQAYLMVGMYCWGMCQHTISNVLNGNAWLMAEQLGLVHEPSVPSVRPVRQASVPAVGLSREQAEREMREMQMVPHSKSFAAQEKDKESEIREREIRRRTMWSIFVMDKWMSAGDQKKARVRWDDMEKVQLPCSDRDFRFGNEVKTGFLAADSIKLSQGDRELDETHILATYIRLVDIWGRCSAWSCKRGRLRERFPPWHPRCKFYILNQELDRFVESLSSNLVYSISKLEAHLGTETSSAYIIMHTLFAFCRIVLHREYIPYVPVNCTKPCGPLDEPTFDPKEVPPGFWLRSAEQLFNAARQVMDIVKAAKERNLLVETPQVGFAIYTAAHVGIVSILFSWMDVNEKMCDERNALHFDESRWNGATGFGLKMLREMSSHTQMSTGWFNRNKRLFIYYSRIKQHWKESSSRNAEIDAPHALLALRDGGPGGGLQEYTVLKHELEQPPYEEEELNISVERQSGNQPNITSSPILLDVSLQPKLELLQSVEHEPNRPSWIPINNRPTNLTPANIVTSTRPFSATGGWNYAHQCGGPHALNISRSTPLYLPEPQNLTSTHPQVVQTLLSPPGSTPSTTHDPNSPYINPQGSDPSMQSYNPAYTQTARSQPLHYRSNQPLYDTLPLWVNQGLQILDHSTDCIAFGTGNLLGTEDPDPTNMMMMTIGGDLNAFSGIDFNSSQDYSINSRSGHGHGGGLHG